MNNRERAEVILSQLGGVAKLSSAGARDFLATMYGVQYNVGRRVVVIDLKDDLYDVTVFKTGSHLTKVLARASDIFADDLAGAVAGLVEDSNFVPNLG